MSVIIMITKKTGKEEFEQSRWIRVYVFRIEGDCIRM